MDFLVFSLPGVAYIFLMMIGLDAYRSITESSDLHSQRVRKLSIVFGVIKWTAWAVGLIGIVGFAYGQLKGKPTPIIFGALFFWTAIGNMPLYSVCKMIRSRVRNANLTSELDADDSRRAM